MADEAELMRNKELVARFFRLIPFGPGNNLDVLDEIVAEDYIQHNPFAGQGREGLREFFTSFMPLPIKRMNGGESIYINIMAEGDLVVRQDVRARGMLIDIFRIEDGMLKEHWDAFRPATEADRPKGF
ncbi:nuclear transport factor 2 family protein [Croceicoccus bisphenolivorans]|uniref:nuclear transport factor 2 family protein n=1 Tax=Croceicoccus bisphenolivorans TaxID=1783232 RepID=UPI000831B43D|nr:nuclear transport factor 2 family protein [Croceicoccus bisphenolivorans]